MLKLRVFAHKLVNIRLLTVYLLVNELLHSIPDGSFLIVVYLLSHQTPSKALASATIARDTSIFTAPVLLPNLSPIWL